MAKTWHPRALPSRPASAGARVVGISTLILVAVATVWLGVRYFGSFDHAASTGPTGFAKGGQAPLRVMATIALKVEPTGLTTTNGIWVTTGSGGSIFRIDPVTNRITNNIRPGQLDRYVFGGRSAVAGRGVLWVVDPAAATDDPARRKGSIIRVDTTSRGISNILPLPETPLDVDQGAGSVWVATPMKLVRLDSASNREISPIPTPFELNNVAVAPNAVWASGAGKVLRANPETNTVAATFDVPGGAGRLAVSQEAVWVVAANEIVGIDPVLNTVRFHIPVARANDVAVDRGLLWIYTENAVEVRSPNGKTVRSLRLDGRNVGSLAVLGGDAWITDSVRQTIRRVG